MERQAFNFKIQGFSADMMKTAAGKIQGILPNYKVSRNNILEELGLIVLTVHDELIYEAIEYQAKEFAAEVKYIMENCVCLSVPIIVDVSIVNSYGN